MSPLIAVLPAILALVAAIYAATTAYRSSKNQNAVALQAAQIQGRAQEWAEMRDLATFLSDQVDKMRVRLDNAEASGEECARELAELREEVQRGR